MWVAVLAVLYPLMTTDLTFHLPGLGITTCFDMLNVIRHLARNRRTAQKQRAVRLMAAVLLVFVVCFAPNNALLLAHTLDPFIYYFASKEFRHKLRQMLRLRSLSGSDVTRGAEHKESFFSANRMSDMQDTR
ncbi:hypothetical protein CRUP_029800, partial [Coryphaenoides rupestris]